MSVEQIVFYFFASILVFSAAMVVISRNSVFSALFLVLAFFTSSAIWLLLEAEFLAIVLVLVYVGAVMVLFLFVVMMLDVELAQVREGFIRYLPIGLFVAILIFAQLAIVVGPENFGLDKVASPLAHEAGYSNTKELGNLLYTVYVYPFEIAAALLLVAIIAAISLTLRRRPSSKYQDAAAQVNISKNDRVRVVKMEADNKFKN